MNEPAQKPVDTSEQSSQGNKPLNVSGTRQKKATDSGTGCKVLV